jgi:hypothetical protein
VKPMVMALAKEAVKSILGDALTSKLGMIMKALCEFLGANFGAAKESNFGVSITGALKGPEGPASEPVRQSGWTLHLSGFFRTEVGFTFEVEVPEVFTVRGELWRGTEVRNAAAAAAAATTAAGCCLGVAPPAPLPPPCSRSFRPAAPSWQLVHKSARSPCAQPAYSYSSRPALRTLTAFARWCSLTCVQIDLIRTFFCNALFTSQQAQLTTAGKGLAQACTPL